MTPDLNVATSFLDQLRPNGPWVITAINPNVHTNNTITRTFTRIDDGGGFVAAHNGEANIYYSLNPTKTALTKKATKADISQGEYVHADLDPNEDETPEAAKARYLAKIETLSWKPTAIIDSGNGIQALWQLETELGPEHFNTIEACSKALTLMLGSKPGTQNIDRILRLPGTVNWPTAAKKRAGRVPCMSRLITINGARYPLAIFPHDKPNRPGTPEDGGHHEQQDTLPPALVAMLHLPNERPCGGYATRSEALFALLTAGLRQRVTEEAIIAACLDSRYIGKGIYTHIQENRGEPYLKAQIEHARGKIKQPALQQKTIELVCAKDVVIRSVAWVWYGHLARANLELMTGLPDRGKSQIHCHFAACVTTGNNWPDGKHGPTPGNVIMVTAEDTRDQTIVPRLIAAKANLSRVHFLKMIKVDDKKRTFLLGEDLEELAQTIQRLGNVALVTLDPITAFMGSNKNFDSHRATDVRSQLNPLQELSERVDVLFSAITHPPKHGSQKAIDQFIGSQAFIAAARVGHVCADELVIDEETGKPELDDFGQPVTTGFNLFTTARNALLPKMPTLAYKIEGGLVVGQDPITRENITAPRIVWDPTPRGVTADQAVATGGPSRRREGPNVKAFLQDVLANGPVKERKIEELAASRTITINQLKKMKAKLNIQSKLIGFGPEGYWVWQLPELPF
jgi:putative DNA primase/helicase